MKDPYSVLGAKKGDDPQELLRKYNGRKAAVFFVHFFFLPKMEFMKSSAALPSELPISLILLPRFAHSLGQVQRSAGYARFRF